MTQDKSALPPFELTLADQIQRIKNWKEPITFSAAAVIVSRRAQKNLHTSPLDAVEILLTKRLQGARANCFQMYVGGYVHPNDTDPRQTAIREAGEELGLRLDPNELWLLSLFGPIKVSTISFVDDHIILTEQPQRAEPNVSFTLAMYFASLASTPTFAPSDGEVEIAGWHTVRNLIENFGQNPCFNYPTVLKRFADYITY